MAVFSPAPVSTSVLVLAVSAAAMIYGIEMTRYEVAAFARADASPEIAAAYSNFVGLRGRARRALAPEYAVETASRVEIENVLVVEPTNGFYWLALAENLQDGGGSRDEMLAALHMSEVVEPQEAATMGRRAIFILSLWDDMPESDRRLASAHLVELGERLPTDVWLTIVRIIAGKPDSIRAEIKLDIQRGTGGDRRLATFLGL